MDTRVGYAILAGMKEVGTDLDMQFGGNPIKVGEEEYSLFRDHE